MQWFLIIFVNKISMLLYGLYVYSIWTSILSITTDFDECFSYGKN